MVKIPSLGTLAATSILPELRSYGRSLTTNPPIQHRRQGKEPYSYYWTTYFLAHDPIPQPTLLSIDHPTAVLHNLVAKWHCIKHEYVPKPSKRGAASRPLSLPGEEKRATFDAVRKKRTAALKLYRRLDRSEADQYLRALEQSPLRVWKRPSSPARPAGVTEELVRLLEKPEYRQQWHLQRLQETDSVITEPQTITSNIQDIDDGSYKLVKGYRFDKMAIASNFMRLACRVMDFHDHHPQLLMQFLPDARMFEVKISTWTHTPRMLPEPSAAPSDAAVLDSEFDRVTCLDQQKQTTLSETQPKIRKTIPARPGLTRKDFLLAWELDEAENQTRIRTMSVTHKREKWATKVAAKEGSELPNPVALTKAGGSGSEQLDRGDLEEDKGELKHQELSEKSELAAKRIA